MNLNADRFADFFTALDTRGRSPFPWQTRLARLACEGNWPACLALPTASGKTACIDIAVFALACQAGLPSDLRTAPRRIFFVVDRRVIVDEAFDRARELARRLQAATDGILKEVADALRELAQDSDASPLHVCQLRGGIYRDDAWVRSPLQPTVVASTVDQVGSRLLFRGYGVSDSVKPLHAGLVGNDSLIILDEAHCAQPFRQTLLAVSRYRGERWAESPVRTPFRIVEMSATPRDQESPFRLDDADLANPDLASRRNASKPARLLTADTAKGKNALPVLAKFLQAEAEGLAVSDAAPKSIAIIVNRVRTARLLYEGLAKAHPGLAHLMIGRMRPIDRDRLTEELQEKFRSGAARSQLTQPHFIVATQCLEVGADFDFDAMICECASLDALRQRFGRLNRLGRDIQARAAVVIAAQDISPKKPDPIYGDALPSTWHWLSDKAVEGIVDFGIDALEQSWQSALAADPELADRLQAPALDAPVMLPAHVDCWCQTSPMPTPDPDVSLFLHGPNRGQPEVQLCWRADLSKPPAEDAWTQAVSLCPPVSAECLAVPLWLIRQWLFSTETDDDAYSDLLGGETPEDGSALKESPRQALLWRGSTDSQIARQPADIRPGDTIVLPAVTGGWRRFGHLPAAPFDPAEGPLPEDAELPRIDLGSEAIRQRSGKVILRLHPTLWSTDDALAELRAWALDPELDLRLDDLRLLLRQAADALPAGTLAEDLRALGDKRYGLVVDRYHGGVGAVLRTRRRVDYGTQSTACDDRDDTTSIVETDQPVPLADHLAGVAHWANRFAGGLGELGDAATLAARCHDFGKADPRFQAYLRQASLPDARLWAKHPNAPVTYDQHRRACARSGRPKGARHELLSVALLQARLRPELPERDLVLHLLAAHHGFCRPFAPAIPDPDPVDAAVMPDGELPYGPTDRPLTASTATGLERLDAGIPERFWRLNRRHGWWGLAYLEAIVRLADWQRSADESRGVPLPAVAPLDAAAWLAPVAIGAAPADHELLLPGLDGANPLAFLAALGTIRMLSHDWPEGRLRMSWQQHAGAWRPVLHAALHLDADGLLDRLGQALVHRFDEHPATIVRDLQAADGHLRQLFESTARAAERQSVDRLLWLSCLASDPVEDAASQLQVVRRDYFLGNLVSIVETTDREHLRRSLLEPWDYADSLDNQSLHWDPSEDRRYALQWHQPSGDPNRKKHGGMLGANRLALEALPLHPLIAVGERAVTVGFSGTNSTNTRWTWPLWETPIALDTIAALLRLPVLQDEHTDLAAWRTAGIAVACRSRRILVQKTPNLTPATIIAP